MTQDSHEIYFRPSGPVYGDTFFGRSNEIRKLQQYVEANQSVLILGERRIGKTSFLTHAYKSLGLLENQRHVWYEGPSDLPYFANVLLPEFGDLDPTTKPFEKLFSEANKPANDPKIALYLNDIDEFLRRSDELDELQRILRLLIDNGHTICCATSFQNLDFLVSHHSTPPIFNVFSTITLAGFTNEDAVTFLAHASQQSGDEFSDAEIQLIIKIVGLVPCNLQRFGFHLFLNQSFRGSSDSERLDCFSRAFDDYLNNRRQLWAHQLEFLSDDDIQLLLNAVNSSELDVNRCSNLIGRGFLDVGENRFATMGSIYPEFLRSATPMHTENSTGDRKRWVGDFGGHAVKTAIAETIKAFLT